jgi:hypothetical protein
VSLERLSQILNDISVHSESIFFDSLFLILVDSLHGSFSEACNEPLHVCNGTVYQKFFYQVLIVERFEKPYTQSYIFLKSFSYDLHKVRDSSAPFLGANHSG